MSMPNIERKSKRTVISIEECQPKFDFDEAAHSLPFTFPDYQRDLIIPRIAAGLMDLGIIAEMPEDYSLDKRVLGIYGVCFFALVAIYFFLYMLSASQTPGMKRWKLVVVTSRDELLNPTHACMR